jgi:hypothetical protein
LEKLAAATVRVQRKDELEIQLATLEQAARELLDLYAQLANLKVRPNVVDELDALDRQIAALDAQVSAAAAHLAIAVSPAGTGKVHLGAEPLEAQHNGPVLVPTEVTVADLAVITVTPAANPREETRQSLVSQRTTLLRSLGVASAIDAHALLSKRRDIEAARKGIHAQLKSLGVDCDPEAAIARLKSSLAQTDAAIVSALAETERSVLPSTTEIEEEKLAITQQRALQEGERAKLEAARAEQQTALESTVEERSAAESRLEQIRLTIAEDLAICPDSERSAREAGLMAEVLACETAHETALTTLAVARATVPDGAEIQRRETRCERLEQAVENQVGRAIGLGWSEPVFRPNIERHGRSQK